MNEHTRGTSAQDPWLGTNLGFGVVSVQQGKRILF